MPRAKPRQRSFKVVLHHVAKIKLVGQDKPWHSHNIGADSKIKLIAELVPEVVPKRMAVAAGRELIEPMGAETLIHARTKTGSDIRVVVPREKRVKTGEVLHLVPDRAQTHVFAEDGRAVRA